MDIHKKHEIIVFDIYLTEQEIQSLFSKPQISDSFLLENKIYQLRLARYPCTVDDTLRDLTDAI